MIKTYPAKILRTKIEDVPKEEILEHGKDLSKTLDKVIKDFDAIGLAANQLGYSVRAFGAKFPDHNETRFFFNPHIVDSGGAEISGKETCLSFPGVFVTIKRLSWIKLQYVDINGEEKTEEFMGQEAVIVAHETDHLNGITLAQKVSKGQFYQLQRQLKNGVRKMKKYQKKMKRLDKISKELEKIDEAANIDASEHLTSQVDLEEAENS